MAGKSFSGGEAPGERIHGHGLFQLVRPGRGNDFEELRRVFPMMSEVLIVNDLS
jgi:hypothetical protein